MTEGPRVFLDCQDNDTRDDNTKAAAAKSQLETFQQNAISYALEFALMGVVTLNVTEYISRSSCREAVSSSFEHCAKSDVQQHPSSPVLDSGI